MALRVEARARARPIRIAYLVPQGESSHEILDAVFATSVSLWGGRYHPIVPWNGQSADEDYLAWVEVYDPDIIYSYADLDAATLDRLGERFGPSFFEIHEILPGAAKDSRRFTPRLPVEPLTCLSVAMQYGRAHPPSAPQPMRLVDCLLSEPHDRFIDDNFGTYRASFGAWPMPPNLADLLRPIYVGNDGLKAQCKTWGVNVDDVLPSVTALLSTMARGRNSFGLANLAADSVPRVEFRSRRRPGFTLIVGSTFADRLLHWNLRSHYPAYVGRDFTGLVVSPERFDDPAFTDAIAEFIAMRNFIESAAGGGHWVTLTSASLDAARLDSIKQNLLTKRKSAMYHVDRESPLHLPPSKEALANSGMLVSNRSFGWSDPAKTAVVAEGELRLPECRPEHLAGLGNPSQATAGAWAMDVSIDRENSVTPYSNVTHTWQIPRRLRMAPAFCQPYKVVGFNGPSWTPRANRHGGLVLSTAFQSDVPALTVPSDEDAFAIALTRAERWSTGGAQAPRDWPFAYVRPSDKGRYLTTTLKLFGGLFSASGFLLHSFWQKVLGELGATLSEEKIDGIAGRLRAKLTGKLDGPETFDRIAEIVAKEAYDVRIPNVSVRLDTMTEWHKPLLDAEAAEIEQQKPDDPDYWLQRAKDSLPESLHFLCGRGVLAQGYEWSCRGCYHRNWNGLANLGAKLACSVCGKERPAPIADPWQFRLDGFVQRALREHGVLPLIWCLHRLANDNPQHSFYFLGPHELYLKYPQSEKTKNDHELDALVVIGTQVHLCEAKTSVKRIKLDSLVKVAERVRPDFVTLAVMEALSDNITKRYEELQVRLQGTGIVAKLLTLQPQDISSDASLRAL